MATFNDYLSAIAAAASNLKTDGLGLVGLSSDAEKNAKLIVTGYQEYTAGMKGDKSTKTFQKWLNDPALGGKFAAEKLPDAAKRGEAVKVAEAYMEKDGKVKTARDSIFKDGQALFEQGSTALGGNLFPMLIGLAPLLLSMFGLFDMGGTFGALAIGAIGFLVSGALMDENSIGGQAWSWIKEKTGLGAGKTKEVGGPAATPPVVKEMEVRQFGVGKDIVVPAVADVDIDGTKRAMGVRGTLVEGDNLTAANAKVKLTDYVLLDTAGNPTEIAVPIPADKQAVMEVKGGKVSLVMPPPSITQSLSDIRMSRAQADFVVGRTEISSERNADKSYTIKVRALTDMTDPATRTFKGTLGADGALTITDVLVREGDKEPVFKPLPAANQKTIAGAGIMVDDEMQLKQSSINSKRAEFNKAIAELSGSNEAETQTKMGLNIPNLKVTSRER